MPVREEAVLQTAKAEDLTLSEPSISEFGLEDIEFKDSDFSDFGSDLGGDLGGDLDAGNDTAMMGGGGGSSHTVAKGETLYRISKQYGVSVQDLKDWNNLSGNIISIGQKLIVSNP